MQGTTELLPAPGGNVLATTAESNRVSPRRYGRRAARSTFANLDRRAHAPRERHVSRTTSLNGAWNSDVGQPIPPHRDSTLTEHWPESITRRLERSVVTAWRGVHAIATLGFNNGRIRIDTEQCRNRGWNRQPRACSFGLRARCRTPPEIHRQIDSPWRASQYLELPEKPDSDGGYLCPSDSIDGTVANRCSSGKPRLTVVLGDSLVARDIWMRGSRKGRCRGFEYNQRYEARSAVRSAFVWNTVRRWKVGIRMPRRAFRASEIYPQRSVRSSSSTNGPSVPGAKREWVDVRRHQPPFGSITPSRSFSCDTIARAGS
jgi:hypothetical protein